MLLKRIREHKAITALIVIALAAAIGVCCWLPSCLEQREREMWLSEVWYPPPPGFRAGGVTYFCYVKKTVEVTDDEVEILGYIEDYLKTKEDKYVDGISTYSGAVGEPYGEYQGQMLLRFDGGWHPCEAS